MSILFLDKIKSGLSTPIIEGLDVAEVLLIDPDPNLPPMLLKNRSILKTQEKKMLFYNDEGQLYHEIDINETDLSGLSSAIEDVDKRVDDTNQSLEDNVAALNLEVKANNELAQAAQSDASEAKSTAGTAMAKANGNANDISSNKEDIDAVDAKFEALEPRVSKNETDIGTNINDIKTATANAATAQARADAAYEKAKDAQGESVGNSIAIAANSAAAAANKVQLTSQKEQIRVLEGTTATQQTQISNTKRKARNNQTDIREMRGEISTVRGTADSALTKTGENATAIEGLSTSTDETFSALNTSIDERFATVDSTFTSNATDRNEIRALVEGNEADIGIIQEELNIEGLGGFYRQGQDLIADSISSSGSSFTDEFYTPPESPTASDADVPTPVGGTYQYFVKKQDGSYDKLLEFNSTDIDAVNKPIKNVESGGDEDTSAANIGDVKRIATVSGGGLKPTDEKWDMLSYPVINAGSIGFNEHISSDSDGAAYTRYTTGDVEIGSNGNIYFELDGKIHAHIGPNRIDLTGSNFVLGKNTDSETRSDSELINWGTLKEDFNSLETPNPPDHTESINTINSAISEVEATANAADTLSQSNKSELDALVIPPDLTQEVADNASAISTLDTKVNELDIPDDVSEQVNTNTQDIATVKSTADAADALSKSNAGLLENALSSDEYGWDVNNLNVYNVSRLSRTNNAVNSSGLSIGDSDVNLHADTVGITNSNSATTYAVFSSGGLNLNNYPLTRMASGNDTDTNAANIGDVKRIAANTTSNLDGYAKLNEDVSFHKVNTSGVDFTDSDSDATIQQKSGKKLELKVGTVVNAELSESGMKLGRDVNASQQNINNMGDINFSSGSAILGHGVGNLDLLNINKISRNDSNDANSVKLENGFNTYKSNSHNFETNDDVQLASIDSDGIHLSNSHEDSKGNTSIRVDSANQNTVYDNIGYIYFNSIDKETGEKKRIFLSSANGSVTFDHAVRSKEGFTNGTATFNTNTDKAAFIDFRTDSEVKLGAHSQVKFAVAGKTPLIITQDKLDFSSLDSTMKINHGHNIDVIVSGTTNVAFKSNGMKLLSAVDGNGQNINHCGDIHFNKGKKLYGSEAGNLQLRYVNSLWRGDGNGSNIQFDNTNDVKITGDHIRWFHSDGNQYGGISKTGINLRDSTKIVGLPKGEEDTDATNIGHIKELISENASGGGAQNFLKHTSLSSGNGKEYYAHSGDHHMSITYSGSHADFMITLDSMRNGGDINEDVFLVYNSSNVTIYVRPLYNQLGNNLAIPPRSYAQGWTNRTIGRWETAVYMNANHIPHQRVMSLGELNPTISSDNRQMTKNIIAAMPTNTTLIAYHNPQAGGKWDFITNGKTGDKKEGTKCVAVIFKQNSGHATGFSTTEGASRVYSRMLDGTTGIWNSNDTSASFGLAEDIPLDEVPEDQVFFTGDQGIVESYLDDDEMKLRPLEGYNVPQQEQDIQVLQAEANANKVNIKYFKNESLLTIPYTQEHPIVDLYVLDTSKTLDGHSLSLVDDDTHKYSGVYNSVGSLALSSNVWTTYSYYNAYKHNSENWYVVFNFDTMTWVILETETLHTSLNEDVGSTITTLGGRSQLPESFGSYSITISIDDLDSLEFIQAEANKRIDTDSKTIIIDFGDAKPSGKVIVK